jgi:hypothetical protein
MAAANSRTGAPPFNRCIRSRAKFAHDYLLTTYEPLTAYVRNRLRDMVAADPTSRNSVNRSADNG